MTEIIAKIDFDSYEFRRVKPMGHNCVVYTKPHLIEKEVCIIPVDMHTTDRYIETCKGDDGTYHIYIPCKEILLKTVSKGKSTGRVYLPRKFVGQDVLIIEPPQLDYF